MRVVLDTCALLAIARGERMDAPTVDAIQAAIAAKSAYVPAVAALEIGQKWTTGKLRLTGAATAREWYERAVTLFRLRQLPVSAGMMLAAYELPEPFHKDPADRLIVAIARLLHAPVVTVDRRILDYGRRGHVVTLAY